MGSICEALGAVTETATGKDGDRTSAWLVGQASTATAEAVRERLAHDPRLRRDPMARVNLMESVRKNFADRREVAAKEIADYETQRRALLDAQELSEVTCTSKMLEAIKFTGKAAGMLGMVEQAKTLGSAVTEIEEERRQTSGTSRLALALALESAMAESRRSRTNRWPLLRSKRLYDDEDGPDGQVLLAALDEAMAKSLVTSEGPEAASAPTAMRQALLLGRLMDETIPKADNADGRDMAPEDVDTYAINQARLSLEAMLRRLGPDCERLVKTRMTTEMARSSWRCSLSAHDAVAPALIQACQA